MYVHNIDGLVQDCSNSSAVALELLQSCAKASIWLFGQTVTKAQIITKVQITKYAHNYWSVLYLIYIACSAKTDTYKATTKHNKPWKICLILGVYYTWYIPRIPLKLIHTNWYVQSHDKTQQILKYVHNSWRVSYLIYLACSAITDKYKTATKHNKSWTVCKIHGIYRGWYILLFC